MTQAENYQPQVRDTSNGPNVHTYIPRADGTVLIGGVVYIPQPAAAAPVAAAAAQPVVLPPGGPAIPVFNVLTTPQYPRAGTLVLAFFP